MREFLRQKHPEWTARKIEGEARKNRRLFGGTPMKFREDSIAITTHPATPIDKQYATLAVIHDALHACDYPLSPWKANPPANPFRYEATEDEISYFVAEWVCCQLQDHVAKLDDEDRLGIETMLTAVSKDLLGVPRGSEAQGAEAEIAIEEVVTLEQAAALARTSKRTLERYLQSGELPHPDFPGGGGKAHKWRWSALRPSLEKVANLPLPQRFPGSRIV